MEVIDCLIKIMFMKVTLLIHIVQISIFLTIINDFFLRFWWQFNGVVLSVMTANIYRSFFKAANSKKGKERLGTATKQSTGMSKTCDCRGEARGERRESWVQARQGCWVGGGEERSRDVRVVALGPSGSKTPKTGPVHCTRTLWPFSPFLAL